MSILVIDVGSSSVRTALYDEQIIPLDQAFVQRSHRFKTNTSGGVTADAIELRKLLEDCIDEILQHTYADNIRAVGMATFVGNLLGLDALHDPITPVYTYADMQCSSQTDVLRNIVDTSAIHQRTGCLVHTAYQPPRLKWIQETQPEIFEQVHLWCDFATYCYQQWFGGEIPCSNSVASWSGLLNRETLNWDDEWLEFLKIPIQNFPRVANYTETQCGLRSEYRVRWSTLDNVPFYLAVGDGVAANIGSGGIAREHPVLTIGTTSAIRIVTEETLPPVPSGLWSYRVDEKRHLMGGATTEGGNIFQWAMDTFKLDSITIENELVNRLPDAHGLTILPLLAGERSPGWQSNATGTIDGLRLSTTPIDIIQALLESVALRLSFIVDQVADVSVPILAGGGALTNSKAWRQIIANALGHPLHLLMEKEVTMRGIVQLVLRHLDPELSLSRISIQQVVMPDLEANALYREARQRQQHLYQQYYLD